jgi:hypothetical protein
MTFPPPRRAPVTEAPPAAPYVLADVGPDGAPQAMLVTPNGMTVVDADTALALICELLLVLAPL